MRHPNETSFTQNFLKRLSIIKPAQASINIETGTKQNKVRTSWLKILTIEFLKWCLAYVGIVGLFLIVKAVTS